MFRLPAVAPRLELERVPRLPLWGVSRIAPLPTPEVYDRFLVRLFDLRRIAGKAGVQKLKSVV